MNKLAPLPKFKNITSRLLDAIEVVEREDACNTVRRLPVTASLEEIARAAKKDARLIEELHLELAHFASDLRGIAGEEE